MKLALIYNRNQRVGLGERLLNILKSYPDLEISQFGMREIQSIEGKFDLYFRIDDGDYSVDIPSNLHPCAWWISDTHLPKPYKKIRSKIKNYDFVFCAQKEGAERLYKETTKLTYWIPWAADEVPYDFKYSPEGKKWDICFIGTRGKYSLRKVVLEILSINYRKFYIGRAHFSKLRDYYSKTKIVVNYSINNDINARIFEAMSSGALVITHKIVDNGFKNILEENKHLVIFDDILKEMREKIDYYLENVGERERIAKQGFEYVKNNHTYRQRLVEMFGIIGYKLKR